MQLRYADDLVEGAVFVCAGRRHAGPPPLQARRFHLAREKVYSILDPDARNAAFFNLHLEWFREWGLEKALVGPADGFPLLRTELDALVFRRARLQRDEGAELYVSPEHGQSGVVTLCIARFDRLGELERFLRHEFAHVHDMLDPAFGYSPGLGLPEQNAAQRQAACERYRLLWDIAIDGRLAASSPATAGSREQYRLAFERAFGFWPKSRRTDVFDSLWGGRQPRHADLLALASDPRGLHAGAEPRPGAACSLCGFATFSWAEARSLSAPTIAAIRAGFPSWLPDQGACRRCVEIHHLAATRPPPAA